jgi:hypothetical protein
MKATPDLFNLVKSLTKNEKRYVTLFLSSGLYKNNKNSLSLFRSISRQTKFDESSLKKQFSKSFASRLSAEKNKLFDLILESLMFLYRDAMPERKILRNRARAWFLIQKGMPAAGLKYFHKSREMAKQYEFFPVLAQLAYFENHQARITSEKSFFSAQEYHKRDKELLELLNTDLVLHTLFTELINIQLHYGNDIKPATDEIEQIIKHPLLDPSLKLTSFSAQMSRLEIRSLYYSLKNNNREAYHSIHELVALNEKSPIHLDQNYGRYCNALATELMYAVLVRDYIAVPQLVLKTRKAAKGMGNYFTYDFGFVDFAGIGIYELLSWRNRADQTAGPALLSKTEKQFSHYRPQLNPALLTGILYLLGTYHFYLGNFKKALHYLNDLIDSTGSETGQNYQCMTRLVKILLHYDLGHYDLLPSLVQSTTRMLQKNERYGLFEKELLSCFRKSTGQMNKAAMQKLLDVTRKHAPAYYSYGAWSDFEFEAWAESHLKSKPLAQLIEKNSSVKINL